MANTYGNISIANMARWDANTTQMQFEAIREQALKRQKEQALALSEISNPFMTQEKDKDSTINSQKALIGRSETNRYKELHKEFKFMLDIDNSDEEFEEEMKQAELEAKDDGLTADQIAQDLIQRRDKRKVKVEILPVSLNTLKRETRKNNFPLIEEYDFKRDTRNPDLNIELKPSTRVRDYQE